MQIRRQQRCARAICLILAAARVFTHVNAQALLLPRSLPKDSDQSNQEPRANNCSGAWIDISIVWGSLNRSAQVPRGVALVSTDYASRTVVVFDQVLISRHTGNIGALCRLQIQEDAAIKAVVALSTPATVRLLSAVPDLQTQVCFRSLLQYWVADLDDCDQLPRDAIKAASTSLQTLHCLQSHVLHAAVVLLDDTDLCQALRCL